MNTGPQTELGDRMHAMKYRGKYESFRECVNRISGGIADNDDHFHQLQDIFGSMRFMPAGRVQSAIGSTRAVTAYNCFVSGTIEDAFVNEPGSIMQRASEAAATMRTGGGIGYDFSTLRPRGDMIRSLQSHSSGPVSFMRIFDAICHSVSSSGHRRGAQMGVMRVDHPDIEEFVQAKQDQTSLTGFNISVGVTDEFMEAALSGEPFMLRWGGRDYREIDAAALWDTIMRANWDWAEPGVLFIDAINRNNNLRYCETIAATNPCAEQPLPPHGACLLGSFNLAKYVTRQPGPTPADKRWSFDFDQLREDIPHVVRAMDNVVDVSMYPLREQKIEAQAKRRMGLGVTGLANAAEALGLPYGSTGFLEFETRVLTAIRDVSYSASCDLAVEKGAFAKFDAAEYCKSPFVQSLPDDLQEKIRRYGIRNSHLTSIAPTGTISICADNVSSAIEPVFGYRTARPVYTPQGQEIVEVDDYGVRVFGVKGRLAEHVTPDEHIAVLVAAQSCVDSSVSKTCNVTAAVGWEGFKRLYSSAWERGAKGCSIFNQDGKRGALLKRVPENEDETGTDVCFVNPETGQRECA